MTYADMIIILESVVMLTCFKAAGTTIISTLEPEPFVMKAREPLQAILKATSSSKSSVVVIFDDKTSSHSASLLQSLNEEGAPQGISVFEATFNQRSINASIDNLVKVILLAQKLRKRSCCVTLVSISEDLQFMTSLAQLSLQNRLLVWSTRLLVVSHLNELQLRDIMRNHWSFSMMNTMFINLEMLVNNLRWRMYTYFPYSVDGPTEKVLATWTRQRGIFKKQKPGFFSEKYRNFYGATVNIANLPWAPYWMEKTYKKPDGSEGTIYYGSDGTLLNIIGNYMNFTFYNVPCKSWQEVMDKVASREAFFSPIRWTMILERLAVFDLTYAYDFSNNGFCMQKPPLLPQWQSLKNPLNNSVWLVILASLVVAPIILYNVISAAANRWGREGTYTAGEAIMEITGTLLGQNISRSLPKTNSGRTLMITWMIYAFVIGSAFRGNLTAHLMLPKFSPRAENMEQLIKMVDIVHAPAYADQFKEFFLKSKDPTYQIFSNIMSVGESTYAGMQQALQNRRSAVMDNVKYTSYIIADKFTKIDGSTDFYIGKSGLLPATASWAVSHDAPYAPYLDKYIQGSIESGLYNKWSSDVLENSRKETMKRLQEELKKEMESKEKNGDPGHSELPKDEDNKALSIVHIQGPLFLLFLGTIVAFMCFVVEVVYTKYVLNIQKQSMATQNLYNF